MHHLACRLARACILAFLAVLLLAMAARAQEFPPDPVFDQIAANRDAYGRVVFLFGDSVVMLCMLEEIDFSTLKEKANDSKYMVSAMADLMRKTEAPAAKSADPLWPMHSLASAMNTLFAAAGRLDTPDGGTTIPAAQVVAAYAGSLGLPFPKDVAARAEQITRYINEGLVRDGDILIFEDAGFHGQDPDAYERYWMLLGQTVLSRANVTLVMSDMFDAIPDGMVMGFPAEAFRFEAPYPSAGGQRSHNGALRDAAAKLAAWPESKGKVVFLDLRQRMNAFKAALETDLGGKAIMPEGIHPSPWGVAFMAREYLRATGLAQELTNTQPYLDMLAANAARLSQPRHEVDPVRAKTFIDAWLAP
ncbi:SGNH/GDSL hydrolase family protein [Desulfovibrio sp. TomC]|uniref:SGNH/GDSL hydrolase family protein n=1 Tax=Desulfovibrio sp. TomC TaxID=1562888 RepID=UPI000573A3E6|nr:SGNH/GDSL hydrolase family protein [Desulfovibrio sp. TomC]KHK03810.1 hypothetical protein NY78_0866 [Desulfovibrio sp. TomC]